MFDKQITIKKLEDLNREVARIEFSCGFHHLTIEAAIVARQSIERLMKQLRHENEEDLER